MAPVADPTQPVIKDKQGNVLEEDPEMKFLREEESYFKKFYQKLYPENMKTKGFPDFLGVMRMLETDQQTVFGVQTGSPKNKEKVSNEGSDERKPGRKKNKDHRLK